MKETINNLQNALQALLQQKLGLAENHAEFFQLVISIVVLLVFAFAINRIIILIIRWVIKIIMPRIAKIFSAKWVDALNEQMFARRSAHLIAIFIIYWMLPYVVDAYPDVLNLIQTLVEAYIVILTIKVINATLHAGGDVYEDIEKRTGMPVNFVTQTAQIVTWAVGSIILVSVLFDTSIQVLLAGLAGVSAVLMLVFKDSILGFVSGIMLIGNDMLRVGDWIQAPQYDADGTVTDIGLTTVKVQNFDNTISTIPSYSLFSESFRNWRGMYNSKARRIKRAIAIDMDTISFVSQSMLDNLKQIKLLQGYLEDKQTEIDSYNLKLDNASRHAPNTRQLTNIGVFREYAKEYLKQHPMVQKDMTTMVRQLPPTQYGLPLEIYTFLSEQQWDLYEGIQSDIFDHFLSVLPQFGLRSYQSASSHLQASGFDGR